MKAKTTVSLGASILFTLAVLSSCGNVQHEEKQVANDSTVVDSLLTDSVIIDSIK
jgi:hypothetical protein